jgi:hypothetical protein
MRIFAISRESIGNKVTISSKMRIFAISSKSSGNKVTISSKMRILRSPERAAVIR